MRFLSVCSGIEAASVAWEPLGWQASGFAEIEPFPCAVLAHHYPDVPNHGDMTLLPAKIRAGEVEAPDLLCGGTPCQAFSVAGLRQSLNDARGNLTLTFCEIADAIDAMRKQPSIVFWENVPGVLNTKDNAFGCFLGALAGEDDALIAPGGRWANAGFVDGSQRAVAWRVLDAQYFGVAQRRRRVFVVASARADFDPAAILFEFEGVRRDTAPSREAGKAAAGTVTTRSGVSSTGGIGTDEACGGYLQPVKWPADIASTLNAAFGSKLGLEDQHINGGAPLFVPIALAENTIGRQPHNGGNGDGFAEGGPMYTLNATGVHGVAQPIAFAQNQRDEVRELAVAGALAAEPGMKQQTYIAFNARQDPDSWPERVGPLDTDGGTQAVAAFKGGQGSGARSIGYSEHVAPTLPASDGGNRAPTLLKGMAVRRLTPVECERLQGFPDNYTNIPWRKQPESPDGPRYKALGNSWAVPVVRWIGERIERSLG